MFRIRFKMSPPHQQQLQHNHNKEWTCCFGLHVHTATILIGLWHLFLNILALSIIAVIWRNPHMMEELENYDYASYNVDLNAPALPTPLSKVEPPYAYRDHSLNYQNFDMGGLVCTCMIAITLMMIYGTIKGKPSHLLPFFCLQLFDFAITTLTAAGYLCYLQAIHRLVAESHRLPWREKLLELSPEELVVVVLVVFICVVFLKAYSIGIVWRCYKYLTLRQQNLRTLLPCVLASDLPPPTERAYSTLLPNYDEAIAQYMKQAPPPSYQVAMSNYNVDENVAGAGVLAAGAVVNLEALDNNNDVPNNNNTMHVNANTPPMQRNQLNLVGAVEAGAGAVAPAAVGFVGIGDADVQRENDSGVVSFNDVVIEHEATTPPPTYDAALVLAQRAAAQNGDGGDDDDDDDMLGAAAPVPNAAANDLQDLAPLRGNPRNNESQA